jgi:hypothetical protein
MASPVSGAASGGSKSLGYRHSRMASMIPGVPAGKLTLAGLPAIVAAPPPLFQS